MPVSSPKKTKATSSKTTKKTKATKKKTAKKKAATKKEAKTGVHAWLEKVNKERAFKGKAQIRMASEVRTPYGLRRPTPLTSLNIALGGGFHAGGVVEVQGSLSATKTYLSYCTAGEVQRIYGSEANILLACSELRPDKGFARMASFCIGYSDSEISELEIQRVQAGCDVFTPEEVVDLKTEVGNVVVVMAETAEKLFEVIVDALEWGGFQLIIIDSMGALLTKAADEGEVGDRQYAGASIPVTAFVNKVFPLMTMDRGDGTMLETTILGINQARANIGGSRFERKTKAAMGAYSWRHGMLVSLLLERGGQIKESEADGAPVVGRTIRWLTDKGKAGTRDGIKGSYDYYHLPRMNPVFWKDVQETWYGGIDTVTDLAFTGVDLGIVSKNSTWLSWENKERGVNLKAQGMDNFAQALAEQEEAAALLHDLCFKEAGVFVRHR